MNNKGFTLIELIAMVLILGILMLITVPNMAGIIKNNKEIAATEDFNRLVNNAKAKFNVKAAKYPKYENSCVVLGMSFVNTNSDIKKGINGGKYIENESFIVVRKDRTNDNTYEYSYFVRLVEEFNDEKYEVPLIDAKVFSKDPKANMPNLPPAIDADLVNEDVNTIKNKIYEMGVNCSTVDRIYV